MFHSDTLDCRWWWWWWGLSVKDQGRQGSTTRVDYIKPNFLLKGFQEYSEVVFIPLAGGVILYNPLLSFEFVQEKPGNKVIFTIYK